MVKTNIQTTKKNLNSLVSKKKKKKKSIKYIGVEIIHEQHEFLYVFDSEVTMRVTFSHPSLALHIIVI